nr:disease resistance-like protein DSC1 [Ziziphus jujuba var. spinosa]
MASSSQFSSISSEKKHEIQEKYDVFLSFRGEDTRNTFASYLYAALSANQISTFMDDHELERGDEISPTLRKAIEESNIWVIILSENYASSTWCLDELVHILECKKKNKQSVVMPIFYGVEPSTVRKQKGSYGAAFAQLEDRFRDNMEKVHQWKAVLTQVADLCGLDSKEFRPENKLIQQIVEDVSKKLPKYLSSTTTTHINGHLIGIEKKIKEIESKLCIGSKDVRIIGIWGMGGIGKTTLASVLFQRLSYSKFEGHYFLWNVREEYARYGPDYLRKKLLLGLLNHEAILRMDSPFVASPFIHNKLRRKKVLMVLDDVGTSVQLEALVEGYDQLAPGSRIIITTRNVQVLKKVTGNIYKVEGLNHSDSLELFHLNTFGKKTFARDRYEMLSIRVASYANGNPLALKVLGCFLHSKSKEEWEAAINKLQKVPNPQIQDVLRISYEGLDDKETQNLFLDLACLFSRHFTRDHVESILDFDDSFVKTGIRILIHKSLIESSDSPLDNELRMHDLLRQMGQAIVRNEHKEPGNCSRLWDAKDICQILERSTGTAAVEGISLNLSQINRDVKVCPAALSKMYNLRILKIYCDNIGDNNFKLLIPQSLDSYDLSNQLRYFQWDLYTLKSLPSKLSPENLVELVLRGSHVKKLWNNKIQSLPILRRIDLSYSRFLTELPDLSQAPNLESINLEGCTNLVQVLSPLQNLQKLTYLNLSGCSNLRDFKEISRSTGYMDLVKSGDIKNLLSNICQLKFTSLKGFMQSFTNNLTLYSSQAHVSHKFPKNLTNLHLRGTSIEEVPSSIWCLSGLAQLDLGDCQRLKSLPTSICELKSLESIDLSGCLGLEKFPEILEPMENLKKLFISRAGLLKGLPETIENLISLTTLSIQLCEGIENLPNNLCNLRKLRLMNFDGCSNLEKLPPFPPALEGLDVQYCRRLKSLPELPSSCVNLDASYCTSLDKISNWRAPFLGLHHSEMSTWKKSSLSSWFSFYGCQKLDHNTRNNIAIECAVIRVLSAADFKEDEGYISLKMCYPGDEIPKWFTNQTPGTSMNIMLPPYWNNDNFLGLALCVVFDRKKFEPFLYVNIECKLTFKTTDDEHSHEFDDGLRLNHGIISPDHMFIWSVSKSFLQNSKLIGLSWPCTCSTEASIHFQRTFFDLEDFGVDNWGSEHCEIKKCGIWLVYKEDIERFDAETKSKRKRSFDEYCEASGSCEVVDSHQDDDDDQSHHMINSKKFKSM